MNIFISYSRGNTNETRHLLQDLEGIGHNVWMDKELTGGQAWWDRILNEIENCDLFVFALSSSSIESAACNLECKFATSLHKRVLPILVADEISIGLLPLEISRLQIVDYRNGGKELLFELIKAIRNLPEAVSLPDPFPSKPRAPISYLGELKDQISSIDPLSFESQSGLLIKLKERIKNANEKKDIEFLLGKLRVRDDLYAKIAKEIDQVLKSSKKSIDPQKIDSKINRKEPIDKLGSYDESGFDDKYSAKIITSDWQKQYIHIEVALGVKVHTLEYFGGFPADKLHLNQNLVARTDFNLTRVVFNFKMSNGTKNVSASFILKCSWTGNFKGLILVIDNEVVLNDGEI